MSASESYRNGGADLIRGLLSPEVANAMALRISQRIAQGGVRWLVPPSIGVKPCYEVSCLDLPMLLTFLWGMTPKIEEIVGVALLPTYSYFRTYQMGDVCRIHADRPACEHSLSLTLAYSDDLPWALEVADVPATPERCRAVPGDADFSDEAHSAFRMAAGDAVIYRGHGYRHGRTAPNPNRWSAHLFMHWVSRDGPHRDLAFDGKPMTGLVDFRFPG